MAQYSGIQNYQTSDSEDYETVEQTVDSMTQEQILQINCKIAEKCGWKIDGTSTCDWTQSPDGKLYMGKIPNYFGSLNYCHEMEKTLNRDECFEYGRKLFNALGTSGGQTYGGLATEWLWHATAPQRCHAFFLVHGWEWPEEK